MSTLRAGPRPSPRFSELDAEAINVEHHVHTSYTDGQGTISEILREARKRGLTSLAFTEHVRRDTDWFSGFADEVRSTAEEFPDIHVLVGCEAKALDREGTLDVSEEIRAQVDLVLGSVHRVPDGQGEYLDYRALSPAECAKLEFDHALGLARYADIDVLAHPGGMTQRIHGFFPEEYFEVLMTETLGRKIAIEISSSYLRDPEGFVGLCRRVNPHVSIGSDVHRIETVGACRELVRPFIGAEQSKI